MFTARKKIAKEKGQEPDSFEESVAQVLLGGTDQCMCLQRQHEATSTAYCTPAAAVRGFCFAVMG